MKSKALIRIIETAHGVHITFYAVNFSIPRIAISRELALRDALGVSKRESEKNAKRIIQTFGIEGTEIRCPEGFVMLPSDTWCCKITKDLCCLQSFVDTNDKSGFLAGCDASVNKKEEIFTTIVEQKYNGFHHVPGRYLCPACKDSKTSKSPFSYHYRWETALLDMALGLPYKEVKRLMPVDQFNNSYLNSRLCAACCIKIANELSPSAAKGLELLEFEINPR